MDQLFRFCPAKTGIGNGFSINMLSLPDLLVSGLDIAFDHNTLDQSFQFLIDIPAVKHFFDDTDLLGVLLVGGISP